MKFFEPNRYNVGVTFVLLLVFMMGSFVMLESDANKSDDYTRDAGFMVILTVPLTLIAGLDNLATCGDMLSCGIDSTGPLPIISFFGLILELLYLYTIACAIVFVVRKFSKRHN